MDKPTCDSIGGTFSGDPTKIGVCCQKGAPLNTVDNMCCEYGGTFTVDNQKNGICCPYGTTFQQGYLEIQDIAALLAHLLTQSMVSVAHTETLSVLIIH